MEIKRSTPCYVAVGSNHTHAKLQVEKVLATFHSSSDFSNLKQGKLYQNEAIGFESQTVFVNSAFYFETTLSLHNLLALLESIEVDLGRSKKVTENILQGS